MWAHPLWLLRKVHDDNGNEKKMVARAARHSFPRSPAGNYSSKLKKRFPTTLIQWPCFAYTFRQTSGPFRPCQSTTSFPHAESLPPYSGGPSLNQGKQAQFSRPSLQFLHAKPYHATYYSEYSFWSWSS